MKNKIYRLGIIIEGYDNGFWNIYYPMEVATGKEQLKKSLKKFFNDCIKYIDERLE